MAVNRYTQAVQAPQYQAMTMQEMALAPAVLKAREDKQREDLLNLDKLQSEIVDNDEVVNKKLGVYGENLDKALNDINEHGVTSNSLDNLVQLKRAYSDEIVPLNKYVKEKSVYQLEQNKAKAMRGDAVDFTSLASNVGYEDYAKRGSSAFQYTTVDMDKTRNFVTDLAKKTIFPLIDIKHSVISMRGRKFLKKLQTGEVSNYGELKEFLKTPDGAEIKEMIVKELPSLKDVSNQEMVDSVIMHGLTAGIREKKESMTPLALDRPVGGRGGGGSSTDAFIEPAKIKKGRKVGERRTDLVGNPIIGKTYTELKKAMSSDDANLSAYAVTERNRIIADISAESNISTQQLQSLEDQVKSSDPEVKAAATAQLDKYKFAKEFSKHMTDDIPKIATSADRKNGVTGGYNFKDVFGQVKIGKGTFDREKKNITPEQEALISDFYNKKNAEAIRLGKQPLSDEDMLSGKLKRELKTVLGLKDDERLFTRMSVTDKSGKVVTPKTKARQFREDVKNWSDADKRYDKLINERFMTNRLDYHKLNEEKAGLIRGIAEDFVDLSFISKNANEEDAAKFSVVTRTGDKDPEEVTDAADAGNIARRIMSSGSPKYDLAVDDTGKGGPILSISAMTDKENDTYETVSVPIQKSGLLKIAKDLAFKGDNPILFKTIENYRLRDLLTTAKVGKDGRKSIPLEKAMIDDDAINPKYQETLKQADTKIEMSKGGKRFSVNMPQIVSADGTIIPASTYTAGSPIALMKQVISQSPHSAMFKMQASFKKTYDAFQISKTASKRQIQEFHVEDF